MTGYQAPGVYLEEMFPAPRPSLPTGIPAFLGYARHGRAVEPRPLTLWPQFQEEFGAEVDGGYLAHAVRGFFENGGLQCYVVRLDDSATPLAGLRAGLAALEATDAVDLLCAPDVMMSGGPGGPPDIELVTALQAEMLASCRRTGGRFAILDATLTGDQVRAERHRSALNSENGAIYYPWLWAAGATGAAVYVPPCGHVAGIYARCDRVTGVHKAPANEVINGVFDLWANLTDEAIGRLYAQGVNCLRAAPGRGIRVWGARTLSQQREWESVAARRVFLTMGRWLERFLSQVTYEPNDVRLWVRIMRELTAYLDGLFQRGALRGRTAEEAFFVKCDSETNPPDVTDAGMVVTNVGLALAAPAEYVRVRILHGASGVSIQPASATI
ncbi:MAG TPA: phage tail sheath subtilisin-like domain-containing protein [Streptosporangiaceae bacterium]|jgi:hypothetical protein